MKIILIDSDYMIHIKKKSWQNKFIMQCYHVNMSWLSSHKINN